MKTLRITATLLLTLIAATACTGSPTATDLDVGATVQLDGTGFLGGGTMQQP